MLKERLAMSPKETRLLIVDDDALICESLSFILAESGYRVRSSADGFSALVELRNEIPDILLSDLNMPGMSGFELLSVVRRRFPAIKVIAMSGTFSGDGIPPGVAADAFYEKGTNLESLLQIIEAMTRSERQLDLQHSSLMAPIWIPRNGHDSSGEACVVITCPECLRTFSQILDKTIWSVRETSCVYCHSLIHYAIVQPTDPTSPEAFQRKPGTGMPTPLSVPDPN
ncbi:MAG TPA: response regulator [Alloacidobacterium sp.]|nr:response regulator [Alloacidobacterium sp.]